MIEDVHIHIHSYELQLTYRNKSTCKQEHKEMNEMNKIDGKN